MVARPVRRSPGGASEDLRRHPPGQHLRRVQPAVCGRQIAGARHRRGVLGTFSEEVLRARRHRGQQAARQDRAADLAARAGGGAADRRAVRHRARDQRQVGRGTPRHAPGVEYAGAGRSQQLDAGRASQAVASFLCGEGHGLYREHTHRRRARTGLEGHRAVAHLVGAWARRVWPLGPDPRQLSAGAVTEDCLVIGWRTGLPPVVREQLSNDFFDIPLQAQHGSGG